MARAPRGVRKVNELIVQNGRALIITEEDANNLTWDEIPDGTLKINPGTGMLSVKVKGESDWIPAGIKNDGTISIAKDSMVVEEVFTIKTLDDGDGNFSYTNTNKEVRHMPILENGEFTFELEKGSYQTQRNHIEVLIDDILRRSSSTGGIIELSNTRFAINEKLEVGQEITARYINIIRIGNPYPRFFLNVDEPKASEIGDFWLDYDASLEDDDLIGERIEADSTISWNRITGKPTTINGYGITDNLSYAGHTHKMSDIVNLVIPKTAIADGGNADTVNHYTADNNKPNTLAILNSNGQLPVDNISNHQHNTSDIIGINNLKANGGNADTVGHYSVNNNNPNTIAILNSQGKLSKTTLPTHEHSIYEIADLSSKLKDLEDRIVRLENK